MTVSQFEQDVLWEPDSPREAVEGAIASLRVDGLELDEFGMSVMQRVADGEIDEDEAIAIFLDQYRKGDGFVLYDTLSEQQTQELAQQVDALAESLSRVPSEVG